jgi:hypothetical protein
MDQEGRECPDRDLQDLRITGILINFECVGAQYIEPKIL